MQRRTAPAVFPFFPFSLCLLCTLSAPSPSLGDGPAVLDGEVHFNHVVFIDFTVPHPTLIIVQDSLPLRLLGRYVEAGQAGRIETNARGPVLDRESRYMSPLCGSKGRLPEECVEVLKSGAGDVDLALVVRDIRKDSSETSGFSPGTGFSAHSAHGNLAPMHGFGGHYSLVRARAGAELFLVDLRAGQLLFHAHLVGDAASPAGAREKLSEHIVEWMKGVFKPELKREYFRNRIGLNPVGLVSGSLNPQLYGFSYERLLGEGRNSIALGLSFNGIDEDPLVYRYLHLPTLGWRHYFRREGAGPWLGGKAGHVFIDNATNGDHIQAHLAALAVEAGVHLVAGKGRKAPGRVGFFIQGSIGGGVGWKKTWTEGYYNPRLNEEREFGFAATYEAAAGLSLAF